MRDGRDLVWDHLRMEPHDNPEARIRALEQPLADIARATELGTTPHTSGGAYPPPPLPPMPPHAQDYGAQYTPPGYGAPSPRKVSAGIPWVVLGIGAVVFMAIAGGVGWFIVNKSTREFPIINVPSFPSVQPGQPGQPGQPAARSSENTIHTDQYVSGVRRKVGIRISMSPSKMSCRTSFQAAIG